MALTSSRKSLLARALLSWAAIAIAMAPVPQLRAHGPEAGRGCRLLGGGLTEVSGTGAGTRGHQRYTAAS